MPVTRLVILGRLAPPVATEGAKHFGFYAAGVTLRTAQPRRSAEGARLDGFLAESKGPFVDLDLRHFATNYQVSSAKSGSAQPPDRAQICACDDDVRVQTFFFGDPILEQRNGAQVEETRKKTSKKVILR